MVAKVFCEANFLQHGFETFLSIGAFIMTEILKQKSLAIVFGVFGCLILVAAVFQVEDITKFKVSPRPGVAWPAIALGACLVAVAALTAILVERRREKDRSQKNAIQPIPSREDYFAETIKQIENSSTSVLMCVHTLDPAGESGAVKQLHDLLAVKSHAVGRVRLLAPGGADRALASSELAKLGISIRHIDVLEDMDISFSVFDSARAVLPTMSGDSKETVAGVTLESTKLAEMLEGLFAELWSRSDALPHTDFVRYTVQRILETSPSISLAAIAGRLKIDIADLNQLLPSFGQHVVGSRIFFLIGRPCSGKTTIAEAMVAEFCKQGISRAEIYSFNDYEALYDRFQEDTKQRIFNAGDHGGFVVRDYSVLDMVLQQANVRLKIAAPFYRACIVEFARDNYLPSFLHFERSLLENATIVYVKCSLKTCRERNNLRRQVSIDHRAGYVPDNILESYYAREDIGGMKDLCRQNTIEIDTDLVPLEELQNIVHAKFGL